MAAASVEVLEIPEGSGTDRITVFWRNWEPGRGEVTVVCYGSAWTAYFGAMGGETIQTFFADASLDYMTVKLMDYRFQKKHTQTYLKKIVGAIKAALKVPEARV